MAVSTCPKCTNTTFETVEATPIGSTVKLVFIQCASCGAVVGTKDYFETSSVIDQIARKLGIY